MDDVNTLDPTGFIADEIRFRSTHGENPALFFCLLASAAQLNRTFGPEIRKAVRRDNMYTNFTCLGTVLLVDIDAYPESILDIKRTFGIEEFPVVKSHTLMDRKYQYNLLLDELEVLFSMARNWWRQSEDIILTEQMNSLYDIKETRTFIVDLFSFCRNAAAATANITSYNAQFKHKLLQQIGLLKQCRLRFYEMDDIVLSKLATRNIRGTETKCSLYFHMYLDVSWLILSIEQVCKEPKETVFQTVESMMLDLVYLTNCYFKKILGDNPAVLMESHVCACVKKLWLIIKDFMVFLTSGTEKYLELFNNVLKPYDEEFCFWMMYSVASLQFYNEEGQRDIHLRKPNCNAVLLDLKLKSLLTKNYEVGDTTLIHCLQYMKRLMTIYWLDVVKVEPYQLLWDYFFKNINNIKVENFPRTSKGINEFIRMLHLEDNQKDATGYETFLNMILMHLNIHKHHWTKLKGRIYSRLSPNKLKDLNENGVLNVSLLFLTLLKFNFNEIVEKFREVLPNMGDEKKNVELKMVIQLSVAAVYLKNQLPINPTLGKSMCSFADQVAENREQYHILKTYVESLDYIMNCEGNYLFNQITLFGNWIRKYMKGCQHTELITLLEMLTNTAKDLASEGQLHEWSSIFTNIVLPSIKSIATGSNAPQQIGRLAGLICQHPPDLLMGNLYFFTSEQINTKVCQQFLAFSLEDFPFSQLLNSKQEQVITEAWVRFALYNVDSYDALSEKIAQFTMFSCVELEATQRPFMALVKAIDQQKSNKIYAIQLRELCQVCFGSIDKSIANTLNSASQNEANILIIYTNISYLFLYCADMIYSKSKSNCILSRLITTLLLPTDVLIGKAPSPHVLISIEKTWHLFFQGLHNLSNSNDAFIDKVLKDLVVRYLPHFTVANTPFTKCPEHADVIIEKISAAYIGYSCKASDENVLKALKMVYSMVNLCTTLDMMQSFIRKSLPGVLEVMMFSSQKQAAIELVKFIALSDYYVLLRADLHKVLLVVMEKHLAFSSNNYFQMATTLAQLLTLDMKDILPDLKKQITIVERMRGVGYDNTLRQHLTRFESTLASQ